MQPHEKLFALHRKIGHLCVSLGLAQERRAYLPHITLARCGRSTGTLDSFIARNAGLASAPFEVDHFSLYESHLGREGATYKEIAHYGLL